MSGLGHTHPSPGSCYNWNHRRAPGRRLGPCVRRCVRACLRVRVPLLRACCPSLQPRHQPRLLARVAAPSRTARARVCARAEPSRPNARCALCAARRRARPATMARGSDSGSCSDSGADDGTGEDFAGGSGDAGYSPPASKARKVSPKSGPASAAGGKAQPQHPQGGGVRVAPNGRASSGHPALSQCPPASRAGGGAGYAAAAGRGNLQLSRGKENSSRPGGGSGKACAGPPSAPVLRKMPSGSVLSRRPLAPLQSNICKPFKVGAQAAGLALHRSGGPALGCPAAAWPLATAWQGGSAAGACACRTYTTLAHSAALPLHQPPPTNDSHPPCGTMLQPCHCVLPMSPLLHRGCAAAAGAHRQLPAQRALPHSHAGPPQEQRPDGEGWREGYVAERVRGCMHAAGSALAPCALLPAQAPGSSREQRSIRRPPQRAPPRLPWPSLRPPRTAAALCRVALQPCG